MPSEDPIEFLKSLCNSIQLLESNGGSQDSSECTSKRLADNRFREESIKYLCKLAEDSFLHPSILERLAMHHSPRVREHVSENPNTPISSLRILAQDNHPDVRYALAENHNLPMEILSMLCDDENPFVYCRALQTIARVRRAYGFGANNNEVEQAMQFRNVKLQMSM